MGPIFCSIVCTNEKNCFQAFSNILDFLGIFPNVFGAKKKKNHAEMDCDTKKPRFSSMLTTHPKRVEYQGI